MSTSPSLITPDVPAWMLEICTRAGRDALQLAELCLYAGFALGVATAVAEAVVALRGAASTAAAPARAAANGVQLVISALTSLLQALKDVKAWLALIAVGMVLLWIGTSTPDACVPGEYRPKVQQPGSARDVPPGGQGNSQRPAGEPGRPAGGETPQRPAAPPPA